MSVRPAGWLLLLVVPAAGCSKAPGEGLFAERGLEVEFVTANGPLRDCQPKRYPGRVPFLIGANMPMGPWLDPRMEWRKLAGVGPNART